MVERSPYFCFIRGGWVPAVWMRDPRTGFFDHVAVPDTFTTWREADEALRFLRAKRPREAPAEVTKAFVDTREVVEPNPSHAPRLLNRLRPEAKMPERPRRRAGQLPALASTDG